MAILPVCLYATVQFIKTARVKTYGKSSMKTLKALHLISLSLATILQLGNSKSNLLFKEYGLMD